MTDTPATCQRCAHVEHIVGPTQIHRWRCLREQQMQAPCPLHSPISNGRKASMIEEAQSATPSGTPMEVPHA